MRESFIAASMALVATTTFLLGSCGGKNEDSKNEPLVTVGHTTIADFEKWGPDFQLIRILDNFGVITKNNNSEYVKSGSYSAKLQPMGGYSKTTTPLMYFPLSSETFDFDYGDFTKVEKITVQMYNAESTVQKVTMGLVTSITSSSSIEKAEGYTVELKSGWNNVEYFLDLSTINISNDIKKVRGIYFQFENAGVRDVEDAPVLYMDDLEILYSQNPTEIEDLIDLDEGEICSFDKLYQKYVMATECSNPKCIPDLEIVKSDDYREKGIVSTSGSKMLRMVIKPGDSAEGTWPRVVIPEKIMRRSDMMKTVEDDYTTTFFCFDIYNNTNKARSFFPEFYTQEGGSWKAFGFTAAPHKWTTFKASFADIQGVRVSNPGSFKIAWGEYVGTEEYEFFIDSIRIVSVKN